jgi:hypothetical protein
MTRPSAAYMANSLQIITAKFLTVSEAFPVNQHDEQGASVEHVQGFVADCLGRAENTHLPPHIFAKKARIFVSHRPNPWIAFKLRVVHFDHYSAEKQDFIDLLLEF